MSPVPDPKPTPQMPRGRVMLEIATSVALLVAAVSVAASGVDERDFDDCIKNDGAKLLARDTSLAGQLGVNGTPAFVLGHLTSDGRVALRTKLAGYRPLPLLRTAIADVEGARRRP